MKRFLSVLLAAVLLIGTTCVVSAQTNVVITVGSVEGEVGDIVEVPVSISSEHYLVNGYIFLLYDPSVLELQEVWDDEDNPYFEEVNTDILNSKFMWLFKLTEPGKTKMVFATSADTGSATGGVLFTLTFKLLKPVNDGAIIVTTPELCSNNGSGDVDVTPTLVNGRVFVYENDATPTLTGDVNGDARVTLADATRLLYFVNGKANLTPQQKLNGDVSGDGTVNMLDAARLFYYVSGNIDTL